VQLALFAVLTAAIPVLGGCVDPEARYDMFIGQSADMRNRDAGMVNGGQRFDFSGQYLCALATTLATDKPLLFACDVQVTADLSTIDLTLQSLTTDANAEPRVPVGTAQRITSVPFASDGTFTIDLGESGVPGAANPISGSDIVSHVVLELAAHPAAGDFPTYFCGRASGMVSEPISFDLAGSTFAAVQSADVALTTPLLRCP